MFGCIRCDHVSFYIFFLFVCRFFLHVKKNKNAGLQEPFQTFLQGDGAESKRKGVVCSCGKIRQTPSRSGWKVLGGAQGREISTMVPGVKKEGRQEIHEVHKVHEVQEIQEIQKRERWNDVREFHVSSTDRKAKKEAS